MGSVACNKNNNNLMAVNSHTCRVGNCLWGLPHVTDYIFSVSIFQVVLALFVLRVRPFIGVVLALFVLQATLASSAHSIIASEDTLHCDDENGVRVPSHRNPGGSPFEVPVFLIYTMNIPPPLIFMMRCSPSFRMKVAGRVIKCEGGTVCEEGTCVGLFSQSAEASYCTTHKNITHHPT